MHGFALVNHSSWALYMNWRFETKELLPNMCDLEIKVASTIKNNKTLATLQYFCK